MNYLSKLTAIIIAAVLMTIVPAYKLYSQMDRQVEIHVNQQTLELVNAVRNKGYLDKAMYEEYMDSIALSGYLFEVELMHATKVYFPLKPGDPGYSEENTFCVYEEKFFNAAFFKEIFENPGNEKGVYKMKKGDSFTVTVKNISVTGVTVFNTVTGAGGSSFSMYCRYGGMISNEDY